jgi:uncharacterized paraquat-inducible protein A
MSENRLRYHDMSVKAESLGGLWCDRCRSYFTMNQSRICTRCLDLLKKEEEKNLKLK